MMLKRLILDYLNDNKDVDTFVVRFDLKFALKDEQYANLPDAKILETTMTSFPESEYVLSDKALYLKTTGFDIVYLAGWKELLKELNETQDETTRKIVWEFRRFVQIK